MKRILIATATAALAGLAVAAYLLLTGPRMQTQPSIRTWEEAVNLPPAGSLPLISAGGGPSAIETELRFDPPPSSPESVARGRLYYRYYCGFCHGFEDGIGPVGESYVPAPTDLFRGAPPPMSPTELYRAMLFGTGHEPVLARVVPAQHRWPLVHFMVSLQEGTTCILTPFQRRDSAGCVAGAGSRSS